VRLTVVGGGPTYTPKLIDGVLRSMTAAMGNA
jgi:alpha-galactosidase/6-phospho-beta-glucosidase family protein